MNRKDNIAGLEELQSALNEKRLLEKQLAELDRLYSANEELYGPINKRICEINTEVNNNIKKEIEYEENMAERSKNTVYRKIDFYKKIYTFFISVLTAVCGYTMYKTKFFGFLTYALQNSASWTNGDIVLLSIFFVAVLISLEFFIYLIIKLLFRK